MQPSDRRLYLLFTPGLCATDPWHTLAEALRGGVDFVQWRVSQPDRKGFEKCRDICRAASVPLIVNDDVMLAVQGRAQGAHVGQDDMPAGAARRILEEHWLGVSTHDEQQIGMAAAAGADYVGFGPCFPTATKGYPNGVGPAAIEAGVAAAAAAGVPLFAIGGITPANLLGLRMLGVDRIAVSSAILQAQDPRAAATGLRRML